MELRAQEKQGSQNFQDRVPEVVGSTYRERQRLLRGPLRCLSVYRPVGPQPVSGSALA